MSNVERKLATVRKIDEIKSIEGADKICAYRVGGWEIVDSVGKYQVGELVVMLEIDSWVPTELAPFLSKGKEPREYNGVKGERLRTVKLRGQISQGLLLPITVLSIKTDSGDYLGSWEEGWDLTERLGIQKYEKELPACLRGSAKGNFPSFIPKTDQERVQNLTRTLEKLTEEDTFEETEKMEGSSMTVYLKDDVFGVCSRNLDLKEDETNTFWATARKFKLEEKMRHLKDNAPVPDFALQGEMIGPGIQGNIYGLTETLFLVYDVWNINDQLYLPPRDRRELVNKLGLLHVPVLNEYVTLGTVQQIIKNADGKSVIGSKPNREGVVYKHNNKNFSFKAISNLYLSKEKD